MTSAAEMLLDIEVPPTDVLPASLLLGLFLLGLLLLGTLAWRRFYSPLARARSQLKRLPDAPSDPRALVDILRMAGCDIPVELDHARFAPTPCPKDTFLALKRQAARSLEQRG